MHNLRSIVCAECCVAFGITEDFIVHRKRTGKTFYCPNGHGNGWPVMPPDKKIAELEGMVRDLEKKLSEAAERIALLANELEIWKPSEPK